MQCTKCNGIEFDVLDDLTMSSISDDKSKSWTLLECKNCGTYKLVVEEKKSLEPQWNITT